MINTKIQYDFDDLLIEPAIKSDISSRKEINIFDENGMLRLFTAPMFDVINDENYQNYIDNKIYSILPRKKSEEYTEEYIKNSSLYKFVSLGLDDFNIYFINSQTRITLTCDDKVYILIDIANGHMQLLLDYVKKSKDFYKNNLVLMVGNIANPQTYFNLSNAGADYTRLGIGGGSVCTTSANVSIGYSMVNLLDDINYHKNIIKNTKSFGNKTIVKYAKIIADGGMKNFADIIKAYARGAEYIMLGSIFNKAFESSGRNFCIYKNEYIELSNESAKQYFDIDTIIYKEYRGMSTKLIQKQLGREKLTTSEGIQKYNKVEYYLSTWVENYSDYLKSTLSYTNKTNIEDFIGNVQLNLISPAVYKRFNK